MALVAVNRLPSRGELAWFGLMLAAFFAFVGWIVYAATGSTRAWMVLALVGASLGVCYYALPPLRRPMYLGFSYTFYPIGWTVSHAVLAVVFFLVLTPIGLVMRLFGRDGLALRKGADAPSFWVARKPADRGRYFRQF